MGFHPPRRPLALPWQRASVPPPSARLSLLSPAALQPPALAQGTPGLLEFRWENSRDYRKLYFFMTNTQRLKRSEYYLMLQPEGPQNRDPQAERRRSPNTSTPRSIPSRVKLCNMKQGGMLARTRCLETSPPRLKWPTNGGAIEIFPDTPVSGHRHHRGVHEPVQPLQCGHVSVQCPGPGPGRRADFGLPRQLADPDRSAQQLS